MNEILLGVLIYVVAGYFFTLAFVQLIMPRWERTPGTAFLVHLIWPMYLVICIVFGICAGVWWLCGKGIYRFMEISYFLPKKRFDDDD